MSRPQRSLGHSLFKLNSAKSSCVCVCVFFCLFFYFIKISKCVLPGVMLKSERCQHDIKKENVSKETAPVSTHDIFPIINKKSAFNLAKWRNYHIHQFQCNHLDFNYHTDQTLCIILEKLSNPSILTFVL